MAQKYTLQLLAFIISTLLFSCTSKNRRLPIYGDKEIVHKEVDGQDVIDTIYKTIPNFSFLNQDSSYISNKFFDGQIYVADFFFTNCPSICPIMHRHLLEVYR